MAESSAIPAEVFGSENSFYPTAKAGIAVKLKRILHTQPR